MKAVPVETINRIIGSMKNELAIELLKAIIENHSVDLSENKPSANAARNFYDLVDRIRAIDNYAAGWMMNNIEIIDKNADELSLMFIWGDSPQGYDYWLDIASKLMEQK